MGCLGWGFAQRRWEILSKGLHSPTGCRWRAGRANLVSKLLEGRPKNPFVGFTHPIQRAPDGASYPSRLRTESRCPLSGVVVSGRKSTLPTILTRITPMARGTQTIGLLHCSFPLWFSLCVCLCLPPSRSRKQRYGVRSSGNAQQVKTSIHIVRKG